MKAEDRHGAEMKKGDTVEIVYGGDMHEMKIDDIEQTEHGLILVRGAIVATMPAGGVKLTKKAHIPEIKVHTQGDKVPETKPTKGEK